MSTADWLWIVMWVLTIVGVGAVTHLDRSEVDDDYERWMDHDPDLLVSHYSKVRPSDYEWDHLPPEVQDRLDPGPEFLSFVQQHWKEYNV